MTVPGPESGDPARYSSPSAPLPGWPAQRAAVRADAGQIADLMRSSVLSLFPAAYTPEQTASAATYIAHLDDVLIDDGSYFVHEADGRIVACGGWSRRAKLYTSFGFAKLNDAEISMPDGTSVAGALMTRPI